MHVLIARTPRGTTHAVSCKTSAEFGERFTRTMQVQGCAVERLTLAGYAALRGLPAVPVPKGAPWTEEVAALELPAQGDAHRAQHQPLPTTDLSPLDLAVGDAVQTSVIGAATVTHVLLYPDGTRLAVARSRRGEQLLRPGTFTRADLTTAAPLPTPAPVSPPAPTEPPSSTPNLTVMPSLF